MRESTTIFNRTINSCFWCGDYVKFDAKNYVCESEACLTLESMSEDKHVIYRGSMHTWGNAVDIGIPPELFAPRNKDEKKKLNWLKWTGT